MQELKDIYRKAAMEKLKDPEFMDKLIVDGGKIVNTLIKKSELINDIPL